MPPRRAEVGLEALRHGREREDRRDALLFSKSFRRNHGYA